jgi:hypothetical protein
MAIDLSGSQPSAILSAMPAVLQFLPNCEFRQKIAAERIEASS